MRNIPKSSPRYVAAIRRTQAAKESASMMAAQEDLTRENKLRAMVGKPQQTLGADVTNRRRRTR